MISPLAFLGQSKDMPLVMPTIPKLGLAEERERLLRSQAPPPSVPAEANRFDQAKARLETLRAQQQKPEKSVPYSVRKPNWWPGELSRWNMGDGIVLWSWPNTGPKMMDEDGAHLQ